MKKTAVIILVLIAIFGGLYMYASRTPSVMRVERTFNAPVEKVWQVWTEPESIKKWWGPKDYTAPIIQNDLRIDATYLFSMKPSNGDTMWNTGRYKEIILHKKIVATVHFSDETATVISSDKLGVPGHWDREVILTVQFENLGTQTKVIVEETNIPLLMKILAEMGWNQQFDKFGKLLN